MKVVRTMPSTIRTAPLSIAAGALLLVACGGAAPAEQAAPRAPAPEPASTEEPASIEEAQAQIERARTELGGGVDTDSELEADHGSVSSAPAEGADKKPDACASRCRALASMRRAVGALCRLTGDEDARCSDARRTLEASVAHVAGCHCAP